MSQKLTSPRKQARLDRLNEALNYAEKLIAILEAIHKQEGGLYDVKCAIYFAGWVFGELSACRNRLTNS